MGKVLFAKYNRNRRKEFQISTTLYEENGKRYARKRAITAEAVGHVLGMKSSYEQLRDIYTNVALLEGSFDADSAVFEFLEGKNVTHMLLEAMEGKDKEQFLEQVKKLAAYIFDTQKPLADFEKTEQFTAVFGDIDIAGNSLPVTNIDLIFDNIVEKDGAYICLDYEWAFAFKVPADYVCYRSIHYFYTRNVGEIRSDISEKELMNACGIEDQAMEAYRSMEENFQRWVFGDDNYALRYVKENEDKVVQNHAGLVGRVLELQDEVEERNKHIEVLDNTLIYKEIQLRELERHVSELTRISGEKDQHIANLRKGYDRWIRISSPYRWAKLSVKKVLGKARALAQHQKKGRMEFQQFEHPKVSIVIPVYNQFEYTWKCLQSILENTGDISYEVIIGDDLSTDRTQRLGSLAEGIKIVRNRENLRFLKNCNNAAKEAKGDYILFLNNDTQVTPGWLSSLVELMESDERIGMVGSKLIYPDGTLQEAGGIIWRDASGWNYGRNDDASKPEYNYVREVDYISGAAIMIRHALWQEIGGFDELFAPAYCEDSDLAFEVRERGYKVVFQPKSVVVHFEGVSNGTDLSSGLKKYQVENSKKFREKWKQELENQYPDPQSLFCARERNYGKKVILFIDHYVPTYDKDAGSKTAFQYIKMFLKMGYLVKFVGDNFAQMEPYTTVLQQLGVEVLYGSWYATHIWEWIEENQDQIAIAYLNRPHVADKYIHFISRRTNIKIIYYGVDLEYLRQEREAQLTGDKEMLEKAKKSKKREELLLNEADMSYYPSQVEVDVINEWDPEIPVKAIIAFVYEEFQKKFSFVPKEREGLLFVGGFSHAPNADAVKWFIKEIFPLIRKKKEIPFYIAGSNAPEEIRQMEEEGVIYKGFVTEEELHELYHKVRMVVVPLRYGAGIKGKVVEALYWGMPVVVTSIGAEGITGIEDVAIVKDSAQDIANAVIEWYDDERLGPLAIKTQDYMKSHFSVEAAWNIIQEDFS